MSRRRRSKRTRRAVETTINVPTEVYNTIPDIVFAPPPQVRIRKHRTQRVFLKKPKETRKKRVKIVVGYGGTFQDHIVYTDRKGRLNVANQRRTSKMLRTEANRTRNAERKGGNRRRRRTTGQLASARNDRMGIIGSNRNSSVRQLEDAAAVSRALELPNFRR